MHYSRASFASLPSKPGVYVYFDKHQNILYVGKARDLKSRVSSYFTSPQQLGEKTRALVSQIDKIDITIVESELEALLLEAFYIKKYNPKYNIKLTDNKAYILVRITQSHTPHPNLLPKGEGIISKSSLQNPLPQGRGQGEGNYSKVLLARRADDPKSVYFGPFPSSREVKTVLKTIRRVFPYVSVRNHPKRVCLYYHLGLCPCPPMFDSPELRKQYKKNVKNIIRIFEGQSRKIMQELEKTRNWFSKEEKYEEALELQKKINALGYITQPIHRPIEYDINPNLRTDLRQEELDSLKMILNHNDCKVANLDRIECYDISHIQGTNTTASMVVFTGGEKESSQYRKFKIRLEKTPDDFASMQEVLTRRFKHIEWEMPGLLIVDGGKGQVSSAMEVLKQLGLDIPLIGLAKREETIVVPIRNLKFTEVSLPHDMKALQLLQRIRDEAHRFAITYHRKLRSKAAVTSL